MFINIKEIPVGHSVIEQDVTMTDEQIRECRFAGTVFCHAEVERVAHQICIRLSYACRVEQECSRCLEPFMQPVKGTVDVIIQDKKASGIKDGPESAGDYVFSDHDTTIDIRQSVYEEVMINVPIKPLCTDECPGIAYTGDSAGNAKQGDAIDPRWEALNIVKKKMQKDT